MTIISLVFSHPPKLSTIYHILKGDFPDSLAGWLLASQWEAMKGGRGYLLLLFCSGNVFNRSGESKFLTQGCRWRTLVTSVSTDLCSDNCVHNLWAPDRVLICLKIMSQAVLVTSVKWDYSWKVPHRGFKAWPSGINTRQSHPWEGEAQNCKALEGLGRCVRSLLLAAHPLILCVDCDLRGDPVSWVPLKWWYGTKLLYSEHKHLWVLRIFFRLKWWFWTGCGGTALIPALGRLRLENQEPESSGVIEGILG